jgi:hypothetical protein
MRRPLAYFALFLTTGCAAAPAAPASPSDAASRPQVTELELPTAQPVPPPPRDPFALTGSPRKEDLPLLKGPQPSVEPVKLPARPKGVPAAPKLCEAYAKRSAPKLPKGAQGPACATVAEARLTLDAALSEAAPDARDAMLVALETCATFEVGFVRAVRVELAPPVCGDELVEPFLAKSRPSGAIEHTLVGQAIAARLRRAVSEPPKLEAPYSRERVEKFSKGPMLSWFREQARAVEELASVAAGLSSYGRGLVALASGTADLRMVEVFRDVPIPDEFKTDPELANAYFAALDEVLEPRKRRGRDGALVGLREFARAGVIRDERLDEARGLLAKLYGGRRVDALDALALPPAPVGPTEPVEARLAAKLPTFLAGVLLSPTDSLAPPVLAALADRGVPLPVRVALEEGDASLSDEVRRIAAHARLRLGLRTWRADDFDAAAFQFARLPRAAQTDADRLAFALAIALRFGPDDAAALMVKNDGFAPAFADVAALDAVAHELATSPFGGMAAFDAAVLRQIAAPRDAKPAYWEALAERYTAAEPRLPTPALQREASERARAADALSKAIAKVP